MDVQSKSNDASHSQLNTQQISATSLREEAKFSKLASYEKLNLLATK